MQRHNRYITAGPPAVFVLVLGFFLYQQRQQAIPPQINAGNPPATGIQIPDPNCTYFNIPGKEFSAKVSGIRDADDLVVSCQDSNGSVHQVVVRLAEIDSPEVNQPYHQEAKDFLYKQTMEKDVVVRFRQIHDYKHSGGICRIVGWVRLPDRSDVSRELLRRGLAWHYEAYSESKDDLNAIQQQARSDRLGLWADDNPISPWDYRSGVR